LFLSRFGLYGGGSADDTRQREEGDVVNRVTVRGLPWLAAVACAWPGRPAIAAERLDAPVTLSRGPYLQGATPSRVTVRWRVAPAAPGQVRYGRTPGVLTEIVEDPSVTTDHAVIVDGLLPGTEYHYTVGTPQATLAGGDAGFSFVTPPLAGSAGATRLWALGDSGTANDDAAHVRDAFLRFSVDRPLDVWLMLGDDAYPSGTDEQYQRALFDFFPELLRSHALWSAFGNADVLCCESDPTSAPYLRTFSPPVAGEAGGVPSGSVLYYSFDHADIHVVVLDSQLSDRTPGGPMLTWLRRDLDANAKSWLVAAWHHPPYTAGEHDSDFERAHVLMRENALPILEAHGVDLVLGGHSHSYERSFLLDGHYGTSDTLTAAMKKDPGTGRPEEGGAYQKAFGPHQGAVYMVLGNAGQVTPGPLNHPAMAVSMMALGSVVVDVEGPELRATFLRDTGAIADHFVIHKTGTPPPPACGGGCPDDGGVSAQDGGAPAPGASADAAGDATAPVPDGGAAAPASSGCGCVLGAAGTEGPAALLLATMLSLWLARRRSRRRTDPDREAR
jgi:hypothetical protein